MNRRFLLGHGEGLVSGLNSPKRRVEKEHPYGEKDEVYARLQPQYERAAQELLALEPCFCPRDETVFCIDLHPSYLAKSYFPTHLFNKLELRPIGSKLIALTPTVSMHADHDGDESSLEIFVAAKKATIERIARQFKDDELFEEIRKIERIRAFEPEERLIGQWREAENFEVVVHACAEKDDDVITALIELANERGLHVFPEKRLMAQGLCFLPVHGDKGSIQEMDRFSFLRVARPMPGLRCGVPDLHASSEGEPVKLIIPESVDEGPCKVAVFDGGCTVPFELRSWIHGFQWGDKTVAPENLEHGSMVNSALLFGNIDSDEPCVPVCQVDHYRVIEDEPDDCCNLYNAMHRIESVLNDKRRSYEFINLSVGPNLPIDDDEVHAWTAVFDKYLSDGNTLLTVAVGNNGEMDWESGNARIQVPADCVNALSVGASTDTAENPEWARASYSAIGPGRLPGRVKPDVLAFGGCKDRRFSVLAPGLTNTLISTQGTSFAAPYALHQAIAIKRRFPELTMLALKCLLIHKADRKHKQSAKLNEHGWGCLPDSVDSYVLCPDGEVTILFQGTLKPGKYVKAPIPVPSESLEGIVTLSATICYATGVDSQDPANYTQSGLEVRLRPNQTKNSSGNPERPDTKPFFDAKPYSSEIDQRNNAFKWETALHGEKNYYGSTLNEPFFEIHYMAREGGASVGARESITIPYALIVTLKSSKVLDIYDQVKARYEILEPIKETLQMPVQVREEIE